MPLNSTMERTGLSEYKQEYIKWDPSQMKRKVVKKSRAGEGPPLGGEFLAMTENKAAFKEHSGVRPYRGRAIPWQPSKHRLESTTESGAAFRDTHGARPAPLLRPARTTHEGAGKMTGSTSHASFFNKKPLPKREKQPKAPKYVADTRAMHLSSTHASDFKGKAGAPARRSKPPEATWTLSGSGNWGTENKAKYATPNVYHGPKPVVVSPGPKPVGLKQKFTVSESKDRFAHPGVGTGAKLVKGSRDSKEPPLPQGKFVAGTEHSAFTGAQPAGPRVKPKRVPWKPTPGKLESTTEMRASMKWHKGARPAASLRPDAHAAVTDGRFGVSGTTHTGDYDRKPLPFREKQPKAVKYVPDTRPMHLSSTHAADFKGMSGAPARRAKPPKPEWGLAGRGTWNTESKVSFTTPDVYHGPPPVVVSPGPKPREVKPKFTMSESRERFAQPPAGQGATLVKGSRDSKEPPLPSGKFVGQSEHSAFTGVQNRPKPKPRSVPWEPNPHKLDASTTSGAYGSSMGRPAANLAPKNDTHVRGGVLDSTTTNKAAFKGGPLPKREVQPKAAKYVADSRPMYLGTTHGADFKNTGGSPSRKVKPPKDNWGLSGKGNWGTESKAAFTKPNVNHGPAPIVVSPGPKPKTLKARFTRSEAQERYLKPAAGSGAKKAKGSRDSKEPPLPSGKFVGNTEHSAFTSSTIPKREKPRSVPWQSAGKFTGNTTSGAYGSNVSGARPAANLAPRNDAARSSGKLDATTTHGASFTPKPIAPRESKGPASKYVPSKAATGTTTSKSAFGWKSQSKRGLCKAAKGELDFGGKRFAGLSETHSSFHRKEFAYNHEKAKHG